MTDLWIKGTWYSQRKNERPVWGLCGIFSSKEMAIASCRGLGDFIAPWSLDVDLTDNDDDMVGQYYPFTESGAPDA
jgi:hypothetical protein